MYKSPGFAVPADSPSFGLYTGLRRPSDDRVVGREGERVNEAGVDAWAAVPAAALFDAIEEWSIYGGSKVPQYYSMILK